MGIITILTVYNTCSLIVGGDSSSVVRDGGSVDTDDAEISDAPSGDGGSLDSALPVCVPACDPITIDGLVCNGRCQVVSTTVESETVFVPECPPFVGGNFHGDACTVSTDCWTGLFCTENNTCAQICTLESECPEGTACTLPADHAWGVCGYGICQ